LPYIDDYKPGDDGVAPLAKHKEFYETKCPGCGAKAVRETDVSDTFLDSSWYFLRYPSLHRTTSDLFPWDPEITKRWLPVHMYTGGAEHSVLHLLYSRFVTMALHDWGLLDFEEPFAKFYAHGLVIKDGVKMSKSKGNVVNPDEYINLYGADALRLYLMFMGPFSEGGDFRDTAMEGMHRWVGRIWRMAMTSLGSGLKAPQGLTPVSRALHKLVKKVTEDVEKRRYNTAIASMMEFTNFAELESKKLRAQGPPLSVEDLKTFILLLAPFAPYLGEELWQRLNHDSSFSSVHLHPWPTFDPKFLVEDEATIVVQVNGKMRETIAISYQLSAISKEIEKAARKSEKVQKYLEGKTVKKVIFVPGKLINFVV
ncbi:MAG: class I tRNA ligase family protein, partial [Patescibacteria group bacterium]